MPKLSFVLDGTPAGTHFVEKETEQKASEERITKIYAAAVESVRADREGSDRTPPSSDRTTSPPGGKKRVSTGKARVKTRHVGEKVKYATVDAAIVLLIGLHPTLFTPASDFVDALVKYFRGQATSEIVENRWNLLDAAVVAGPRIASKSTRGPRDSSTVRKLYAARAKRIANRKSR